MLPRPAAARAAVLAVVAVLVLAALAGCSDGPPAATVGDPSATTSTAAPSGKYPTYVALGDSYTAAPGVPTTEQDDGCLRSNGNYPTLVDAQLDDATFVDVSCSGASTTSLIGVQRNGQHEYAPQFAALKSDTSLVTLGIGGNDLDLFSTVIAGCAQAAASDTAGHPCEDYMRSHGKNGGDLLLQKVRQIGGLVQAAAEGVRDRSPHATIVLVGYPQPIPAHGTCRTLLPLATGDYPYVRGVFAALGAAMKTAAAKARVHYVDMVRLSRGHDICAGSDAWVNGIATDVDRALAFHPFAEEQQAVASAVEREIGVG